MRTMMDVLLEQLERTIECENTEVQVTFENVRGDLIVSATVFDADADLKNMARSYNFVITDNQTVERYGELQNLIDHLTAVRQGKTDKYVQGLDLRHGRI